MSKNKELSDVIIKKFPYCVALNEIYYTNQKTRWCQEQFGEPWWNSIVLVGNPREEWHIDNAIWECWYHYEYNAYYVFFKYEKDAMLYKLTWS